MERMKYDFNRYAEDFNLYTTKRHESYLKIHQALLDAESQVLQLRGFIQIPDFSKYTKEEISIWLDEKHFTEKQKYPVLNNWENNRKEAMKNVNDLFQLSRHHDANTSCNNAKNFVLDYQLYLSEKIFTDCLELTKKIKHLLINYDPTFCYAANKHNESEKLRKEIEDIFTRITIQMKKELQRGYYDEG